MVAALNIFVTCVVKAREGIFLKTWKLHPENMKTTAFLLTHGLKLNSGMTDRSFSALFSNWAQKKKKTTYGKKESNAYN